MKHGRVRRFIPISGIESEISQLFELHSRATDLVLDVPEIEQNTELFGHTLHRLYAHMIWAEDRLFGSIEGDIKGDEFITMELLEEKTQIRLNGKELGDSYLGSRFETIGEVFRHLQWHWSYHSGQLGLLRKQLGFPYKWQ